MKTVHRLTAAAYIVFLILTAFTGCSHEVAGSAVPASPAADVKKLDDAINSGDFHTAEHLLTAEPGIVNIKDDSGKTPLQEATDKGNAEMIDLVKKHGGTE